MARLDSFRELLLSELRDLYEAENELIVLLPALANASHAAGLTLAFTDHLADSRKHSDRLEQVMDLLRAQPHGSKRRAFGPLVTDVRRMIGVTADPLVRDIGLIAKALRLEHYEIAGYRTARTLALRLEHDDVAELLRNTLDEETAADVNLSGLSRRLKADSARAYARKLI